MKFNIKIIKSRRKSVGIEIKPDLTVLVRAPLFLGENAIKKLVAQKNDWIDKKIKQIENKKSPISLSGLIGVGGISLVAGLNEYSKKPLCIVTYNEIQAKKIAEDLQYFTDRAMEQPQKLATFPGGLTRDEVYHIYKKSLMKGHKAAEDAVAEAVSEQILDKHVKAFEELAK